MTYTAKIYKIVNTINDDIYVGSTKNQLRIRWQGHKHNALHKKRNNGLYDMMNEYSLDCFRIILIEEVECANKEHQLQHEQKFIDELKPKLNKYNANGHICEHNKKRSICRECGGGQICEHNKKRSHCKECGGSSICNHNNQRSQCKNCEGSQLISIYCYDCNKKIQKRSFNKHLNSVKHLQNILPVNL